MGSLLKADGHDTDHAVAGAISGFVTRFACQPLDVVKIRFQLQVEPIAHDHHINEWKYSIKFAAGAGAGFVATIVSFPFDTIRTRLVAQSSNHQVYKGLLHSCSCIIRHESPKTFFNGLLPTLLQIVPHSGLQFAFYGFFTDLYKKYSKETNTTFSNSMVSGSAAGLLAKTAIYPLDLSRKRLQIQGFKHGRTNFGTFFHCTGLLDCLKMTVKVEGVRGLFKGLVPSQLKAAATTALHFTAYEQSITAIKAVRLYISKK
ncbi:mitochondrial thiamine pyrophosphate carrier isoform X2 [Calliopsis andreniformis]|uniref:mitochondrial thiamine pyrophosphate carrier isoform X2 n=1 Tax=Calliopsis andreniformis TaxID=337506 RepID=UPI003FCC7C1C